MKLKMNLKILVVFGIILGAMLLFNTNKVQASTIDDYKCKIEKDGYILYNNYFNTEDVKINNNDMTFYISKEKIEQTTLNNIANKFNGIVLIEINSSNTDIKVSKNNVLEDTEIITLNNKQYVVINCDFEINGYSKMNENNYTGIWLVDSFTLIDNKGEQSYNIDMQLTSVNAFRYTVNIVNEKGIIYAQSAGTNVDYVGAYGGGVQSIPSNLDLDKTYVEYLTSEYIGENAKVDNIGTANYIGKYGDSYKYKASLKNAKITNNGNEKYIYDIQNLRYKGSAGYNDAFWFDKDYVINNETYVEQTKTNTNTKLKFDFKGKFNGTVKAEEISKNDLIYNKVNEELKKYSKDNIYMNISNIYIENGSYEGALKLTFYVGEQYNGKYYSIVHMKNEKYEFEEFEGIVENGKIEITVDSLSPFGISVYDKEEDTDNNDNTDTNTNNNTNTSNSNKGEKDETPKTGTIDIIGYVSMITLISFVGIVALKKKLK